MSVMTIPIGPQHPILKEPISLKVDVVGETIIKTEIQIGFVHRGIEKLAESMTFEQIVVLVERVCGICSHTHTTTFCKGVESLLGVEIPERGNFLRTLMCELERIHSHLLWLGIVGKNIGLESIFMYAWRDRELVIDIMEKISGQRVSHGVNIIGGVRINPDESKIQAAIAMISDLEKKLMTLMDIVLHEETFASRTKGLGILSPDEIRDYGIVGPSARASGCGLDVRKSQPYGIYQKLDFKVPMISTGDVWARAIIRMQETFESISLCKQIFGQLPGGDVMTRVPRRVLPGEVISLCEAPRGELVYYIRSDGSDRPARMKIRTPTLPSLAAFPAMLQGQSIADMTAIVSGADLCIACADR